MCPRLFTIGSFSVPTYGVLVALGFLAGLYLVGRLSLRAGLDADKMTNLGVYVALAAILGAKVFMILTNLGYYLEQPSRIFSLSSLQAGGVFYGGLLAALAVAVWYSRTSKLPPLQTADVLAPAVAIGHSIGRLGCFAAGCCWGKPSSLPWAVAFTDPVAHDFVGVPLNIPLHPTQIYEALGTFIVGVVLLRLFSKPHPPGSIVGWYLVLYSSFRFGVEFLRAETERLFPFDGPFSTTQWIALLLVAAGVFLLIKQKDQPPVRMAKQAA
jgi:phosphatidylglycerol---prolipoprotein diacylglyceryl transferase